jgi:hypothetical protein
MSAKETFNEKMEMELKAARLRCPTKPLPKEFDDGFRAAYMERMAHRWGVHNIHLDLLRENLKSVNQNIKFIYVSALLLVLSTSGSYILEYFGFLGLESNLITPFILNTIFILIVFLMLHQDTRTNLDDAKAILGFMEDV